jgi:hypothetical protein
MVGPWVWTFIRTRIRIRTHTRTGLLPARVPERNSDPVSPWTLDLDTKRMGKPVPRRSWLVAIYPFLSLIALIVPTHPSLTCWLWLWLCLWIGKTTLPILVRRTLCLSAR